LFGQPPSVHQFRIGYKESTGARRILSYTVFAQGNVLGEAAFDTTAAAANNNAAALATDWNDVIHTRLPSLPRAARYPVPAVRVLGVGRVATVSGQVTMVPEARLWRTFTFAVAYGTSAPANAYQSGQAWLTRGALSAHLVLKPATLSDGTRVVRAAYKFTTGSWRGAVKVSYALTVDGAHRTGKVSLRVDAFK
jgi:hypothetical protein